MTWQPKTMYDPNAVNLPTPGYVWKVDKVLPGTGEGALTDAEVPEASQGIVGTWGPKGATESLFFHPEAEVHRFRMWDDDRAMGLEGRIAYAVGYEGENKLFEPLDDYGTGGVGCTILEYLKDGTWEVIN